MSQDSMFNVGGQRRITVSKITITLLISQSLLTTALGQWRCGKKEGFSLAGITLLHTIKWHSLLYKCLLEHA